MKMFLSLALAGVLCGGAAAASDLSSGDPVSLMEAAAGTCLMNAPFPETTVAAFEGSGWEIGELDGGAWEMVGPGGVVFAFVNADGLCRVEAEGVGLDEARSIARSLLNVNYPDQFKESGAGPCDGYAVTTVDGLVEVSFDGLGQDPVCPDPAGAAIVVRPAE